MRTISRALNSLLAALCMTTTAYVANAQTSTSTVDVPRTISYQGLLTNSDGSTVLDGEYRITLSLYADPVGGLKVWEDTYTAPVSGGLFNLYAGSGNVPLPDPATMNRPLWVGMRLNDAPEMYPLTPLSASPYALNVPDNAITTAKLADGAVTAEKVDMEYVSGITVNGENVSSKGAVLNIEGSDDIALAFDHETNTLRLSRATPAAVDGEKKAGVQGGSTDFWTLQGDGRTDDGFDVLPSNSDWIGTSSSSDAKFTIKTDGQTVMRYEPNTYSNVPNIVGGYSGNTVTPDSKGSVIAGGGESGNINKITDDVSFAVIGGGDSNVISAGNSVISGGSGNRIGTNVQYSTIGGGQANVIFDNIPGGDVIMWATIAGGHEDTVTDFHSFIGGGHENTIHGSESVIGGGWSNKIGVLADKSVIGGGDGNIILEGASSILGGYQNYVSAIRSTLVGGEYNELKGQRGFIGGGGNNLIDSLIYFASIVGGQNHEIEGINGFIGGGSSNLIDTLTNYASVVGGTWNATAAHQSAILGGFSNEIAIGADFASIAGGEDNAAGGTHSFVGNGQSNSAAAEYTVVAGGNDNTASGAISTVAGGEQNVVSGDYSAIVGGGNNTASGSDAFIGGGYLNTVSAPGSTVSGGRYHIASGNFSTIGGGSGNAAVGSRATVGGGELNSAVGNRSVIPGGDGLQTTSYAQAAVGFYNAPRGAHTSQPTILDIAGNNDPLFIVGNGYLNQGTPVRGNAFEVSYNGHSIVSDINGQWRNPFRGATYIDNVMYAWGDIGAAGAANSEFGILNIAHVPGSGIYNITIRVDWPQNGNQSFLTNAAITATLVGEPQGEFGCGSIYVSRINPLTNMFTVRTYNGNCTLADLDFMFHLTGRP